jgi:hypothetical protein
VATAAPATTPAVTATADVKPAARTFISNLETEVASFFANAKADVEKL